MSTDGSALPPTFTYRQAREAGLSKHRLYALRDSGAVEQIGRGLFRRGDADWDADIDLVEIALHAPEATLCLGTALARHGLTDLIPASIDTALPRGRWKPVVQAPVTWHSFRPETFGIGRSELTLEGDLRIGIYTPERCIVDAFRLRHREGSDLANGALRRWLRQPGNHPAALLQMAEHFPAARTALRTSLEILLD
ncbi:hypothetical protein GCM10010406_50090 [Streptomyces thermolineatus]|uniref:AbiEi antitoxin N-terminal domain-containing protein n=1 Tax=Streptomyces thermolineatus TaxID=44033 RepID=A0ABN3MRR8_9ACTN